MKRLIPLSNYTSSTEPIGQDGEMYFDIATSRLRIYFDEQWHDLALLSDTNAAQSDIDGGIANTFSFTNNIDGGEPNTNTFNAIIDAGVLI